MAQPPSAMPHPINKHGLNQPFNPTVFQSTPSRMNDNQQSSPAMMNMHSAANKLSHHSQDMHAGFYNNQQSYGHQFNNSNGAGSSSSGSANNFYMGHYSVSRLTSSFLHRNIYFLSYQHLASATATTTIATELSATAIFQINSSATETK